MKQSKRVSLLVFAILLGWHLSAPLAQPVRGEVRVAAAQQVRAGAFPWISSGSISIPENRLGFAKGILVRDPDGHVMQLVEK